MIAPTRRHRLACLIGLWLVGSGCAPGGGAALVIATSWPEDEQRALEADFRSSSEGQGRFPIAWVRLGPGDDPARLVERGMPVDLLLGAPAPSLRRLAEADRLAPIERPGLPLWWVVRRSSVGLAVNTDALQARAARPPEDWSALGSPVMLGLLAMDDPRHDPVGLALARSRLGSGGWAEAYAELVREAVNARPIGRRGGSALASLERGEAAVAPAVVPRVVRPGSPPIVLLPGSPEWTEGAALVRGARHPDQAQAFLQFLAGRDDGGPPPADSVADPRADDLLADLLGATLVDAQQELRTASEALARADPSRRGPREAWMTQAPPWPPASVEALWASDDPATWVEALAEQVAPDPAARIWLLESWRAPRRPIDGAVLGELAGAVDGRLAEEPRFRAWLRAEWTAWARQRYRAAVELAEVPRS